MREALACEGFEGELLAQAYVAHYEQVYKIYGCGDWLTPCIRRSLPHSEMMSKDAFKFNSQKTWDNSLYKEYSSTHSRIDMGLVKRFFKNFVKASGFNVKLYGVDIVVD